MKHHARSQPTDRRSGRWMTTLEGYRAFHPDPLPPTLKWSPQLASALADASLLIGRLAGEGKRLPNPHILIRPFIRREAVLSSRIEGTQATLGELLAAEAGAAVERSPDDLREVANYVAALEYGIERLKTLPLSLRLVRELHERLMAGVRGSHATPGEFRRSQNWIGKPGATLNQASYVPPPPDALGEHLAHWERFLHDRTQPPLIHAALMHYQFEAIHPVPRRQWPRWAPAHHAAALRARHPARAAALSFRVLRGDAGRLLRWLAPGDRARRLGGLGAVLP